MVQVCVFGSRSVTPLAIHPSCPRLTLEDLFTVCQSFPNKRLGEECGVQNAAWGSVISILQRRPKPWLEVAVHWSVQIFFREVSLFRWAEEKCQYLKTLSLVSFGPGKKSVT